MTLRLYIYFSYLASLFIQSSSSLSAPPSSHWLAGQERRGGRREEGREEERAVLLNNLILFLIVRLSFVNWRGESERVDDGKRAYNEESRGGSSSRLAVTACVLTGACVYGAYLQLVLRSDQRSFVLYCTSLLSRHPPFPLLPLLTGWLVKEGGRKGRRRKKRRRVPERRE